MKCAPRTGNYKDRSEKLRGHDSTYRLRGLKKWIVYLMKKRKRRREKELSRTARETFMAQRTIKTRSEF